MSAGRTPVEAGLFCRLQEATVALALQPTLPRSGT